MIFFTTLTYSKNRFLNENPKPCRCQLFRWQHNPIDKLLLPAKRLAAVLSNTAESMIFFTTFTSSKNRFSNENPKPCRCQLFRWQHNPMDKLLLPVKRLAAVLSNVGWSYDKPNLFPKQKLKTYHWQQNPVFPSNRKADIDRS